MVESLIEQLQASSSRHEAFRRLFDLYSPRLYHFFSRRGFPHADCLDLTQETFLGIYKGIGAFRRDASFETWLFKIATNAYRKRLRSGVAEKRGAPEVPLEGGQEDGGPMETLAATDVPAPGEELLRRVSGVPDVPEVPWVPQPPPECPLPPPALYPLHPPLAARGDAGAAIYWPGITQARPPAGDFATDSRRGEKAP
jgi:DNA-directed RNA polymerase specialized sigma24 family protein